MSRAAIVFLSDKNNADNEKWNFFTLFILKLRHISMLLKCILKRQTPKHDLNKIEIYENLDIYLVELPYTQETIFKNGLKSIYKVKKLLKEIAEQYKLNDFILPVKLKEYINMPDSTIYSGLLLYKSLILNILDEIYSKRGIKISELDITIVNGKSRRELYSVIKAISSFSKYITVITENKEDINRELDEIYSDTGLSIRVTDDFRSGLKYADCIINLGGLKEFIINSFLKSKALVINYGDLNKNKILVSNTIINGIVIALPQEILNLLGEARAKEYNQLEIAEAFLLLKANGDNCKQSEPAEDSLMETISREFKLEDYSITDFIGRNGIIDIEIRK